MAIDKERLKNRKKKHDITASGPEDYGYAPADRSEFQNDLLDYESDKDSIAAEERGEVRKAKKRARMLTAMGKAIGGLGKIAASNSGVKLRKGFSPDLSGIGEGEVEDIGEKYDTKRLSLSQAQRDLRGRKSALDLEDSTSMSAAKQRRKDALAGVNKQEEDFKALDAAEADVKRAAKADKAVKKEHSKYKGDSRKKINKDTSKILTDVEDNKLDEDDAVQRLVKMGASEETAKQFLETLPDDGYAFGIGADSKEELAQKEELRTKIRRELILHSVKRKVQEDLEDGKPVSPKIVEALGLTSEGKDANIEEPAATAKSQTPKAGESKADAGGADGDPKTFPYEMSFVTKKGVRVKRLIGEITTERAEDMRRNYKNKDMDVLLERLD